MSVSKSFEESSLQNVTQLVKNGNMSPQSVMGDIRRPAPALPPRPQNQISASSNSYLSHGGYGNYNGYLSYGSPYRSPYSSFGSFGSYGNYGGSYGSSYGGMGGYNTYSSLGYPGQMADDHERRFIQFAEEKSRSTFASVENVVRAFNSLAMMVDNTFFAMTSSFRAVLSVAENFGKLRTMFGHIWYSVNIFRFFNWLYRKLLKLLGIRVSTTRASVAWKQAAGSSLSSQSPPAGSNWPTLAFLGMLISAPYIISKFLPKYEDKGDPVNWKSPGIRAKAVFDFIATAPNELTIQTNDLVTLAPTYVQEEMNLKNTGWAFAHCKGRSGLIPLNYLVINKSKPILNTQSGTEIESIPVPRNSNSTINKSHTKRVSFGETQVFENIDLDDESKNTCKTSQENRKIQENSEDISENRVL